MINDFRNSICRDKYNYHYIHHIWTWMDRLIRSIYYSQYPINLVRTRYWVFIIIINIIMFIRFEVRYSKKAQEEDGAFEWHLCWQIFSSSHSEWKLSVIHRRSTETEEFCWRDAMNGALGPWPCATQIQTDWLKAAEQPAFQGVRNVDSERMRT